MKLSTRQYAKSQLRWIRKQFLPAVKRGREISGEESVRVYVVRGGEMDRGLGEEILRGWLMEEVEGKDSGKGIRDPMVVGHKDARELLSVLSQEETDVPDILQ